MQSKLLRCAVASSQAASLSWTGKVTSISGDFGALPIVNTSLFLVYIPVIFNNLFLHSVLLLKCLLLCKNKPNFFPEAI